MEEQAELLFLSNLYKTWPWYFDQQQIIQIQKRIISMQHRQIVKIKSQKDLELKPRKNKINKIFPEFRPQKI
jgi:ABC-type sugar transport system ATPase subunit